jgi:nucleotide-binding universal stress UspA family protein
MAPTYIAGYDGSDASRSAVVVAVQLARAEDAEVVVAHAHPHAPAAREPGAAGTAGQELGKRARRAAAMLDDLDVEGVGRRELIAGSPAKALHDLAVRERASLLCVGVTHHGRVGRLVQGSVGAKLLHGAPCPVLAVPELESGLRGSTIGVAYDGGEESRRALPAAERLARGLGGRLVLLAAFEPPPASSAAPFSTPWEVDPELRESFQREMDDAADHIGRAAGIDVAARVTAGSAGPEILRVSEDVDLLVTGSRSYGPARSVLLGSVSRHLIDHASCPVLVVPRSAED